MDDQVDRLLVLIPAFPLAAAILIGILGPRWLQGKSHWVTIGAFAASLLCSLLLLNDVLDAQKSSHSAGGYEHLVRLWSWASVDGAYQQPQVPPGDSPLSVVDGGMHDFRVDVTLRADALTAMMLTMVTFVSTLVAIFSAGYMHGDRSYWRFFAYISLFVFSMTMLVSVSNFVLLFVFWEAVGVCSYLLIGFWYTKPEAAAAGKKAFLVNRVGDFGFALALFLIWTTYGTLNFHDSLSDGSTSPNAVGRAVQDARQEGASEAEPQLVRGVLGKLRIASQDYQAGTIGTAICLLLLIGACGKSAQFPLHVWLPDAMEGPTPVSALIHAATMVTAGVYMIARCTPLFMASPEAQLMVAGIGAFTALLAGLIALTQYDLKRVLAYSTVSQLGFMFLGLGAGNFAGITSGMFHLFTHAFFKALLFLGAGSVMHSMGHVIDMRRFSGLRRVMPVTHWTFLCGCLALSGLPFFSGFWSKDGILAAVETQVHHLHEELEHRHAQPVGHAGLGDATSSIYLVSTLPARESTSAARTGIAASLSNADLERFARTYTWFYYAALVTAFLTAFYTFRAFFMTFYGELKIPHEAGHHAHESPPSMTVPLVVLAGFALFVGLYFDRPYLTHPVHLFQDFLGSTPSLAAGAVAATRTPYEAHLFVAGLSSLIALIGSGLATYLYLGDPTEIRWLRNLMDLTWANRIPDLLTAARVGRVPWLAHLVRGADAVGLGWLVSLLGGFIVLVVTIITAPLMLGNFLSPYKLSSNKFFLDEFYQLVIVLPLRAAAWLTYVVDRWIIDGIVNLFGRIPLAVGSLMRSLQMGLVQFYALATIVGVIILLTARLVWM